MAVRVIAYDKPNVVITGGEPTIQNETQMLLFISTLKEKSIHLALETNGTKFVSWFRLMDWITVSPKRGTQFNVSFANEIKVIFDDHLESELDYFEQFTSHIRPVYLSLQPKNNDKEEIQKCLEIVKKRKLWRLSLQLHKMLQIN